MKRYLDKKMNIKFLTKSFLGIDYNKKELSRYLVYLYTSVLFESSYNIHKLEIFWLNLQ